MSEQRIKIIGLMIAIMLCDRALSLDNTAITNPTSPIGSAITPPTSYQSGLIPSANPIDTSGNLIITGNVAGGMNFRGVVPYTGVTNFSVPAGSLSNTSGALDSFLRNSSGSSGFEGRSGFTPYYSPTLTVTTSLPGTRGMVIAPQGGSDRPIPGVILPPEQTGYYLRKNAVQATNRPLSIGQQELEKLIESDITKYPLATEPVSMIQAQQQFWQQLRVPIEQKPTTPEGGKDTLMELIKGPATEANVATLLSRRIGPSELTGPEKELRERQQSILPQENSQDIYEQMKMQFGEPIARPETDIIQRQPSVAETNDINQTRVSSRLGASNILNTYKSFAAYNDDYFNRHIRAAESYMKQGKYYRAADSYTLAIIYKPNDPLGYAGKSMAMFASGEYMSSTLFLARAMEVFPEYAKVKIDLAGMIGDKDTIENRILEAREWADKSGSAELEYLLSYVYYQMNRLEFAQKMIESASKKMPDSKVIAVMKKVIDGRTGNPQQ